jgi:hypothetical protein
MFYCVFSEEARKQLGMKPGGGVASNDNSALYNGQCDLLYAVDGADSTHTGADCGHTHHHLCAVRRCLTRFRGGCLRVLHSALLSRY